MLLAALLWGGGCDPLPSGGTADLTGRLVVGWRIDGQALTQARCTSEGLSYMEVDVVGQSGPGAGGQIGFTEVTCALDRYPLMALPLGGVAVQVRGIGPNTKDARGRECVRRVGTVTAQTTAAYGDTPLQVELAATTCQ